jgi:hypothetical protein
MKQFCCLYRDRRVARVRRLGCSRASQRSLIYKLDMSVNVVNRLWLYD